MKKINFYKFKSLKDLNITTTGSMLGKSASDDSDYDSYDESDYDSDELSRQEIIDDDLKKTTDEGLSDQEIVDNVFDWFKETTDDLKKITDEMFDNIERVLLKKGYEEEDQQIDMSDSIVALFETKSPMDLL